MLSNRFRSSGPLQADVLAAVASEGGSAVETTRKISIAEERSGSGSAPQSSSESLDVPAVELRKFGSEACKAESIPIPPSDGRSVARCQVSSYKTYNKINEQNKA